MVALFRLVRQPQGPCQPAIVRVAQAGGFGRLCEVLRHVSGSTGDMAFAVMCEVAQVGGRRWRRFAAGLVLGWCWVGAGLGLGCLDSWVAAAWCALCCLPRGEGKGEAAEQGRCEFCFEQVFCLEQLKGLPRSMRAGR